MRLDLSLASSDSGAFIRFLAEGLGEASGAVLSDSFFTFSFLEDFFLVLSLVLSLVSSFLEFFFALRSLLGYESLPPPPCWFGMKSVKDDFRKRRSYVLVGEAGK